MSLRLSAGRVEARHAAVEEQGVAAAEIVPEQAGEGAEGDGMLGDREHHHPPVVAHADAVADLQARTVGGDLRMDLAFDHQHRAGLGREIGLGPCLEVAARVQNPCTLALHVEHAVRLEVEVAGSVGGRDALHLAAVLDVEAHRRLVLVVHAGIHGEAQPRRPASRRAWRATNRAAHPLDARTGEPADGEDPPCRR